MQNKDIKTPRIEISKRLVLINSASSAVVLILNLTVLIWLHQYLLKRISPDEYALLPLVTAIMAFAPLLTMVLTGGLGRYITVAYARGDDEEITRICSTMFPLLLAGGFAFLAIGWFAAWHIDSLLKVSPEFLIDARMMMALLVFSTAMRLPLAVFSSGFVVRQKLMLQDMIDVGCQFLRIGLLFALLFGIEVKVLWVIVALVVSELTNLAISTPISIRLVPAQKIKLQWFRKSLAKDMIGYGAWGFVDKAAEVFKQAMDPIILNRFASSMDVSVFHVAGIVPRQLRLMLTPVSRPFVPVLAAFYGTDDRIRLRNTYLRVARYHTWILLLFVVLGVAFRDEIILLYLGDAYSSAAGVMAVLLLCIGLSGLNALGGAIVAAAGHMKGIALRMLLLQIVNLAITILFVVFLQGGALGAAISTLIASILVEVAFVWPFCRKIAGVETSLWLREVVIPGIAPASVSACLCIAISNLLSIESWIDLVLVSIVVSIVYVLILVAFGLRVQDRIDIERLAERVPDRVKPLARFIVQLKI
jgi:O-antigen/teichoic acid export membrane protein